MAVTVDLKLKRSRSLSNVARPQPSKRRPGFSTSSHTGSIRKTADAVGARRGETIDLRSKDSGSDHATATGTGSAGSSSSTSQGSPSSTSSGDAVGDESFSDGQSDSNASTSSLSGVDDDVDDSDGDHDDDDDYTDLEDDASETGTDQADKP